MNELNYNGSLFTRDSGKYMIDTANTSIVLKRQNEQGATIEEEFPIEYWGRILNETALPYKGSKLEAISKNLDFLNARLDFLRKTVTYWDTFNIRGVIESSNDINKIYDMDANSTLLVASKGILWEGKSLNSGDSIIKDSSNNYHIIKSNSSGVFKPDINVKDNKVTITYSPSEEWKSSIEATNGSLQLNTTEVYYNITGSCNNGEFTINSKGLKSITNGDKTITTDLITVSQQVNNTKAILTFDNLNNQVQYFPVVKFYIGDEEICLHHTLSYSGNQWTIEWDKPNFNYSFKVK